VEVRMKSWKTTLGGVLAILAVLVAAVQQYLSGGFATVNWEVLMAGIALGAAAIAAKDSNVSNAPNPGAPQTVLPMPKP
jgi:hypothetical protein